MSSEFTQSLEQEPHFSMSNLSPAQAGIQTDIPSTVPFVQEVAVAATTTMIVFVPFMQFYFTFYIF